ncbi:hypothetical protein TEA_021798 [Camellia sinensis var. sinensis]|uniref:DNA mismatch repair proteins mutS family domain-containing protein n=1 Tax=Camellia sinensis var. sinensis TaxID=542762 RepID=A0A4S4E205_CAMSN|nr:hypothetical protein TEA_021798 [Camellia sinensis var. sinensis]
MDSPAFEFCILNLPCEKFIYFNRMKISFFLCSEELLASLRETLKSVKDILHILKTGSCILTDLAYVYELVSLSIDLNISLGYFVCTLLRFLKVPRSGSSVLQSRVANDFNKMPENVTLQVQLKRAFNVKYCISVVIGVIDVSRSKDKGYGTIVKEGFCDEVLHILAASFLNVCNYSSSPQPPQPTSDKSFHHVELQLDELRQIYKELPEFLEEVSSLELARLPIMSGDKFLTSNRIPKNRIFCAMGSKFMNAEQSTFMIDLHQVGMMLRHATSRSLCLLDEFGKGTLTEDGTGLLGGTINHFITCYDPPKVLVCSHLTEMFNDSCIQESDNIKYYTMSVLQPDDGTDIEDIVFLYRLVPGHALLSYGVPEEVIKRAASLLNAIGNNNHDTIDKMLSFDACNGDLNLFFQDIFPS